LPVAGVALKVRMPGMGCIETLRAVKIGYPPVEAAILMGYTTAESAIAGGTEQGAFNSQTKPCDMVFSWARFGRPT
jgi:DNA-binding NtrC family response regulator